MNNLRWILPVIAGITAGIKTWGIVSNITAIATDLLAKKQAILNIAGKIFNKTAWSNPWVLVIGLIIGAITLLILNFDKIKAKCLEWWDIIKEKYPNVANMLTTIANIIKIVFSVVFALIKRAISFSITGIEFIASVIDSIIKGISNFIVGIVNMLLYSVENITEGIKKIFGGIIEFFTGIFTGNWEQALNGLKSIAEGVFNIIKGIFLAPFTLFSKGINWVIEKINGLKIDVPDWVPVIGGNSYSFNIPTIPEGLPNFATGTSYHRGVIEKINGLKIDVPDWVPVIGGNSYSFNIPTIPEGLPNFATGTSYHRGGPAIINEGGRGEIVDLPNGSKVIPPDKSQKLLDKNNSPINVTVNVYNPNDVDEIINKFAYKLKLAIDNM